TIKGKIYDIPQWTAPVLSPLHEESPIIREILPQLKLTRSRVLILNSGEAHNAAAIARAGHFVTAVESDPALVAKAQEKYGHQENLRLVRTDLSHLPENWNGEFDMVFTEDVMPTASSVKLWRRMLSETGTVLGIFPALEWELRERLRSGFQALYWTRWRRSVDARKSRELVVFARKK
ncbi:MAG: class I SAM-dependent methyltransferase, partial [Pseudobdellovibrionaceae bacterium]